MYATANAGGDFLTVLYYALPVKKSIYSGLFNFKPQYMVLNQAFLIQS